MLLNMYAVDGRDGTVLQNTFTDAPAAYDLTGESIGSELADVLVGQRVGAGSRTSRRRTTCRSS
ncbi:hypothetical protein NKG05_29200 [Oerskovia sp. M15]